MSNDQTIKQESQVPLPPVKVPRMENKADLATVFGLLLSFGLIAGAIYIGQSNANFFNTPSFLIVIFGTLTATAISFTGQDIAESLPIIGRSFIRPVHNFSALAKAMLGIASGARQRGILAISQYENETRKNPFLGKALRLAVDGYDAQNIKHVLQQDIDTEEERNKRAAAMLRRASEVAPAMGLIGTLVGLVQMLANLEQPEQIGADMAVALLTTFYGAIMGTVVMAPLAAKLEKNAADEVTAKTMALQTALSILKQENPRTLEMVINSLLAPSQRVTFFK